MSRPQWNSFEFPYWEAGNVNLSMNNYGEGPIVLEIVNGEDACDQWMTPHEARSLAAKLLEAAAEAERVGLCIADSAS